MNGLISNDFSRLRDCHIETPKLLGVIPIQKFDSSRLNSLIINLMKSYEMDSEIQNANYPKEEIGT